MSAVNSTPTIAADAVRNGANITYNNMTFTATPQDRLPKGLPANTSGYYYLDSTANKMHFLLAQGSATTATSLQYVTYSVAGDGTYSNPSPPEAVNVVAGGQQDPGQQGQQTPEQQAQGNNNPGASNSCDGKLTDGIGWIICPVSNFLAGGMDNVYKALTNFLVVRTPALDPNSSTFKIWAMMRDFANICFVIVFLVIVYSQITQIGLSNYNLKKMLPRLIISAILVNLSYYLCALAIDLSNVIGFSIHDIFMNIYNEMNKVNNYTTTDLPSWSSLTSFILAGGTGVAAGLVGLAAVGGIKAALILLVPSLVLLLLTVLVAFLIMAARQALITVLVIISPLAFVAYVLPNTEKYFDKWKDGFATLLFLFPIFSAIFGGAQIAGLAIMQNANNLITLILGMAVQVAPLAITPMLIKFSGGILTKIGALTNNRNKGMVDRTRNWAKDAAEERKHQVLANNRRFRGPMSSAMRKVDRGRRKRQMRIKQYQEDLDNAASSEYHRERRGRRLADTVNSERYRTDKERESAQYEELRTALGASGGKNNTALERAIQKSGISTKRADELRGTADQVKISTEQIAAVGLAKRVAEEQQKANFAKALEVADDEAKAEKDQNYIRRFDPNEAGNAITLDGERIHRYAAGLRVDEGGVEKVVAIAKKERFKVMKEGIDDRYDTIPNDIYKKDPILYQKVKDELDKGVSLNGHAEISEQAYAYIKRMHNNGGPGKQKVRELIQYVDELHENNQMTDADYLDFREVAGVLDLPSLGRDVVLWASNAADEKNNNKLFTLKELAGKPSTSWRKVSADSFASMDDDSKKLMLRKLALEQQKHPKDTAYDTFLKQLKADPVAMSKLRGEVRRLVDNDKITAFNKEWKQLDDIAHGGAFHPSGDDIEKSAHPDAGKLFA